MRRYIVLTQRYKPAVAHKEEVHLIRILYIPMSNPPYATNSIFISLSILSYSSPNAP